MPLGYSVEDISAKEPLKKEIRKPCNFLSVI